MEVFGVRQTYYQIAALLNRCDLDEGNRPGTALALIR